MIAGILALGVLIAMALFNGNPASEVAPIVNQVTEIKSQPEDWVVKLETPEITYYANPSSIIKGRHRAQMWRMTDYKIPQFNGELVYYSIKTQEEYDCKFGDIRLLYVALYEEHMEQGEALYTHAETYAWEPVVLDTAPAAMWRIACGKN
ncbi:MAG: hypothetical protein R8K20_07725 [Gallionellaceae bacterium]